MFQVASRPVAVAFPSSMPFTEDLPTFPSGPSTVHLPRTLQRPPFRDINRDVLAAIEPELRDIPVEYLKRGIAEQSASMIDALTATSKTIPQSAPKASLPQTHVLPATLSLDNPPTHILAVSSSSSHPTATLIPTHHLVLAAHCANLPSLSPPSSKSGIQVTAMTVPSASSFPILHTYLYTKRTDYLLASLLHPIAPPSKNTTKDASQQLAAACGYVPENLSRHVALVNSLWKNVSALGVFEKELWEAMDVAWEVVLGAVAILESRQ